MAILKLKNKNVVKCIIDLQSYENLIFDYFRGLLSRAIILAQAASPTFTHVYAALVSIINSKVSFKVHLGISHLAQPCRVLRQV